MFSLEATLALMVGLFMADLRDGNDAMHTFFLAIIVARRGITNIKGK